MKIFNALFIVSIVSVAAMITTQANSAPPEKLPPAPTYDVKSYSGTACQPSPVDRASYNVGMICNNDFTYGLVVYCPVVRDDTQGTDGTYEFIVNVKLNMPGEISCTALSFDSDRDQIEIVSDSTAETGEQTLYLDLDESAVDGYYDLTCSLPPAGCIYSYRVYEWESTYRDMTDYNR